MPTIELREPGPIGGQASLVSIRTVLGAAPEQCRAGSWVALNWWAVGNGDDIDILELEAATEAGLVLTTSALLNLDSQLLQLVDGVVASFNGTQPNGNEPDLRSPCDLVIHAFDSSFWRIYAREMGALDAFRSLGADVVDVADEPMPASGSAE